MCQGERGNEVNIQPLLFKFQPHLLVVRIEGCRVVSVADLHGRILGFLDEAATFSSK
jgi:hypothetical protein